jgi:metal-sulfur cluster biosynthetic enzyme
MNKESQVFEILNKVYDPELDQPLTTLGFIEQTVISKDTVEVSFRLPTYWCSPNFAYIMAEDIKRYVSKLDWVNEVKVNLIDHCASNEINKGVAGGNRFSESLINFGSTGGDLEELRHSFQVKAYYARQEKLIKHLLNEVEFSQERLITLSIGELESLSLSEEGKLLREHYLEKKELLSHTSNIAFTTPEDERLTLVGFKDYMLGIKRTRLSMEFNGHFCRGLLEARYNLPSTNDMSAMNR